MSKIVKNTTGSNIEVGDTGITVPANGQYVIAPTDFLLWAASEDIVTFIASGDIVINDGISDLNKRDGFAYLQGRFALDLDGATLVGPEGPQGIQGPVGPAGPPGIFGSERHYVESLGLSQTMSQSSSNPPTKLSMPLTGIPAGTYRLEWGYFWSASDTGRDFRAEIKIDGVQKMYHSQEPKDAGTDQRHPAHGFISNILLDGNHTINLNYWTENDDDVVYIRDARLELWRIA